MGLLEAYRTGFLLRSERRNNSNGRYDAKHNKTGKEINTQFVHIFWMEKGGQMNYQTGRKGKVLIKQDGKLKTAHMHFSKMFD